MNIKRTYGGIKMNSNNREEFSARLGRPYKIRRTGDTYAVTMPREILRELAVTGGDFVEFWKTSDGRIVIAKSDYDPNEDKL